MPLTLGPALGNGKARLDRLAEADLVREQGTLREGRDSANSATST